DGVFDPFAALLQGMCRLSFEGHSDADGGAWGDHPVGWSWAEDGFDLPILGESGWHRDPGVPFPRAAEVGEVGIHHPIRPPLRLRPLRPWPPISPAQVEV